MKFKNYIYLIILSIVFSGCTTTKIKLPASMPIEPDWRQLTEPPIVKRLDNGDFEVTAEFVERSTQSELYIKKIKTWKIENELP